MNYLQHTFKVVLFFAGLMLYLIAPLAQQSIYIQTTLETKPDRLFAEEYSLLLTDEKAKLKLVKEPLYQSQRPRYAKVILGNAGEKSEVAVVVDEPSGKLPLVYIDANNNHDLTDDINPGWVRGDYGVLHMDVQIQVPFITDAQPRVITLPYRCFFFSLEERREMRVALQPRFDRSGVFVTGGKEYNMILHTTDQRGLYSDPKQITLGVDRNLDGMVDASRLSGELFKGGEAFNIGGESYRIAKISDLGERLWIEVSPTKVAPKEHVVIGGRAPDFEFQTLDGRRLRLSDFKGRVVLLDFMATWCGPCIAALPETRKLHDQFSRSKFEIISVSLDGGESSKVTREGLEGFAKERQIDWPIFYDGGGWKNAAAQRYNVSQLPVHVIIDQDGVIRLIGRSGGEDATKQTRAAIEHLIG